MRRTASYGVMAARAGARKRMQGAGGLMIGGVRDPAEKAADQAADRVMRRAGPAGMVRRQCAECAAEEMKAQREIADEEEETARTKAATAPIAPGTTPAPASAAVKAAIDHMGVGRPLSRAERGFFEPRFGVDFSAVRVHVDVAAGRAARALDARAFTRGRDIAFAPGERAPGTPRGDRLMAHELTHVAQQGEAGQATPAPGAAYSLSIETAGGKEFTGPPLVQRTRSGRVIQRAANFANPKPIGRDPLAGLLAGRTPGLTVPTINGNVVSTDQDISRELGTLSVSRTTSGGQTRCRVDPGYTITTSANVTVATPAGVAGWTANVNPAAPALGGAPPGCQRASIPLTMTALPNNAHFVSRVAASEQEHVNDLRMLHDRHIVPFDRTALAAVGTGADAQACDQSLEAQLVDPLRQAALGFALGWQASVQTLDAPGSTHHDTARLTFAPQCASATLTVSQTTPPSPSAGPGNVRRVVPTTTHFNPASLSVQGNDLVERVPAAAGSGASATTRVMRSFASNANAKRALQIIRHYGMNSRNVIGPMEYYLAGGKAPSGPLPAASETAINPDLYQVTVNRPNPGDWAISEVVGSNLSVLVSFDKDRDAAYSAVAELRRFRFNVMGRVGPAGKSPDMRYFRT